MKFKIKDTKEKDESVYKTVYMKKSLAEKIAHIAEKNNTSFNNVIISMIESCLEED